MAYPPENLITSHNVQFYYRDGSQLGVASCDFVSTTPAKADVAPKVSLACWGRGKIGRNSQFYHLKIKQHERRKNHHL